ncbi:tigger transposable element-derived protein 4-like [Dermacentor albipictus]|uniref:tigger transposable element-derived protein 4-like n=1 Tax=Dermacentor albipictus TaxID=60249 RepID=UPI0038FD38C0
MASDLALQLRHSEFQCSNGWLSSLKERNNLTFVAVCGESSSANKRVIDAWKEHTLAPLLSEYGTDDVYNLDKAVLFYKMLQSFAVEDTAVKGQKQGKEIIIVLLGANMCGKHKLPPLVVGKSGKPCCFKNARLPPRDELIIPAQQESLGPRRNI